MRYLGRKLRFDKFLLMLIVFGVGAAFVQAQSSRYQEPIEFEIGKVSSLNVTTRENCVGVKVVSVYLSQKARSNEKVSEISQKISSTYPTEYDLLIFFLSDRDRSRRFTFGDEDGQYIVALFARKETVKLCHFPNGLTEDSMDSCGFETR